MRKLLLSLLFASAAFAAHADQLTVRDRDTAFPRLFSGREYYSEYDGCAGGTSSGGAENYASSQTGSGATLGGTTIHNLSDPCTVRIDLGTVVGNDSGVRSSLVGFDIGNGELCSISWVRELIISDDTNDFIPRIGYLASDTAPADFVGFRYNDDVNAGEWEAVARAGGVETGTVFDTGIVYTAGTSRWFKTCINAAGTSATLWHSTSGPYNMTLVVTHSSNIPTGLVGAGVVAERALGTATFNPMSIHFIANSFRPTTPRW